MSWVHQADEDVILSVKVQPRAARIGVVGILGDALKIRLQAPPVDGKANKALLKMLAKTWHAPVSDLELVAGAKARDKVVHWTGDPEDLARRLEAALP